MKRNIQYAAAFIVLFVIGGVVAGFTFSGTAPAAETVTATTPEAGPRQIAEIEGYKFWTLVNPQPVRISPQLSISCSIQLPPAPTADSLSPHMGKSISVYVNETGRTAMMNELKPKFPVGSVIVKEKLPAQDKTDGIGDPELLTVMVKRERGFNPKVGDWEFIATNGAGTKVDARGRLESCQACHVAMKDRDFISRMYLPEELRSKLR